MNWRRKNTEIIQYVLNWFSSNKECISIAVDIFGCIITAILTIIIIYQTGKLNKKQQALEERINKEQTEMQKRQLKLDAYPYKREVYMHTFSVLEFCHALKTGFDEEDLLGKSCEDLLKIFKIVQDKYVPDMQKTLWSLREAEYIFPEKTARVIWDIRRNFDTLASCMTTPNTLEIVMSDMPSKVDKIIEDSKCTNVKAAYSCCNRILSYEDYILTVLPKELSISNVDR